MLIAQATERIAVCDISLNGQFLKDSKAIDYE
jgi:hypothetical protein